jgi:hypothetical protein
MQEELDNLRKENGRLSRENDILRGMIAKLGKSCHYCGIEDISRCVHGFPGCALADDILVADDEVARRLMGQVASAKKVIGDILRIAQDGNQI